MAVWLVELQGQTYDLEELANVFTTPDLLILREGDAFLLKSSAFDALADTDVYAKAKAFMPSLNGIASVYATGYRNVGMSGAVISIDADGTRRRSIYVSVKAGDIRLKGCTKSQVRPRIPHETDEAKPSATPPI